MVGSSPRIFLVTGIDFNQRQLLIENIKNKVFKKPATPLNILTFYSKEIDIKDLQEKILTFSFDKEKIIIIKNAESLTKEAKEFLFNNLKKILSHNYIILETDKDYLQLQRDKKISSDIFFGFILKNAEIPFKDRKPSASYEISFEGFKRSTRKNNAAEALYILEKLFESKASDREKEILGLQILGVLVGECSYLKNPLLREKSFNYLWETDRLIKEKGLEPRFALEILLTKLLGTSFV